MPLGPFAREYMRLALVAGVVVGAAAPLVGSFLVQRRMSLLGEGIGHVAFAGVAAGLLTHVWPVWTALAAAVLAAVVVEYLRASGRAGDLAVAMVLYTGMAFGLVFTGLAHSLNAGLLTYLFGDLLSVSRADVNVVVLLGVFVTLTISLLYRPLFAVGLDDESAAVAGLPVRGLNLLLAVLAAIVIVIAMRIVGLLLVAALMILPVAAAQRVTASFRRALVASAGLGAAAAVVGLVAAYAFAVPPGGTIVLAAVAACAVTFIPRSVHA